jgi:hypothetical protein
MGTSEKFLRPAMGAAAWETPWIRKCIVNLALIPLAMNLTTSTNNLPGYSSAFDDRASEIRHQCVILQGGATADKIQVDHL